MKTVSHNYKGKKIEAILSNDIWIVLIDGRHYPRLDAEDDESAIDNGQIEIDTAKYYNEITIEEFEVKELQSINADKALIALKRYSERSQTRQENLDLTEIYECLMSIITSKR